MNRKTAGAILATILLTGFTGIGFADSGLEVGLGQSRMGIDDLKEPGIPAYRLGIHLPIRLGGGLALVTGVDYCLEGGNYYFVSIRGMRRVRLGFLKVPVMFELGDSKVKFQAGGYLGVKIHETDTIKYHDRFFDPSGKYHPPTGITVSLKYTVLRRGSMAAYVGVLWDFGLNNLKTGSRTDYGKSDVVSSVLGIRFL